MLPETLTTTAGLSLGAALTIVGLLISFLVWRRKGAASGLRGVAWSLVPLAAGLLGLMNTVWQFVLDVVGALLGLLFNPLVWAGVALTGLAVVLYIVSGIMRAKGVGTQPRGGSPKAAKEGGKPAGAVGPAGQAGGGGAPKKAAPEDDLSDIEDLLRKRGID